MHLPAYVHQHVCTHTHLGVQVLIVSPIRIPMRDLWTVSLCVTHRPHVYACANPFVCVSMTLAHKADARLINDTHSLLCVYACTPLCMRVSIQLAHNTHQQPTRPVMRICMLTRSKTRIFMSRHPSCLLTMPMRKPSTTSPRPLYTWRKGRAHCR